MTVIPDGIEPIEEWRTWNFDRKNLLSHNGAKWLPGVEHRAKCRSGIAAQLEWSLVRSGMTLEQAKTRADEHNQSASARVRISAPTFSVASVAYVGVPSVVPPDGYGYDLRPVAHASPDENCTCGIYAGRQLDDCPPGHVFGKVKLWGKIVPGSKGSRGEVAYPSELHVTQAMADDPALLAYGVPIVALSENEFVEKIPGRTRLDRRPRMSRWLVAGIAANFAACALNLTVGGLHI